MNDETTARKRQLDRQMAEANAEDKCSRCKHEPLDKVARVWGTRAKACLEVPCRFEEERKNERE